MKPSNELVFAMSCTRRASRSFGLTRFSTRESLIASWCVNWSSAGGGEAMLSGRVYKNERKEVVARRKQCSSRVCS